MSNVKQICQRGLGRLEFTWSGESGGLVFVCDADQGAVEFKLSPMEGLRVGLAMQRWAQGQLQPPAKKGREVLW